MGHILKFQLTARQVFGIKKPSYIRQQDKLLVILKGIHSTSNENIVHVFQNLQSEGRRRSKNRFNFLILPEALRKILKQKFSQMSSTFLLHIFHLLILFFPGASSSQMLPCIPHGGQSMEGCLPASQRVINSGPELASSRSVSLPPFFIRLTLHLQDTVSGS